MLYTINGNNLETIFGVEITNAVSPFMGLPDRKASLQINNPDVNGLKIDLINPKFESRPFTFNCLQSGETISEVQNKYWGLFTLLKIGGVYGVYNDYVDMTAYIYYTKQQNLTQFYQNNKGGWSIRYDLLFGEQDPFMNIPNVFLVDDQNRFLVP